MLKELFLETLSKYSDDAEYALECWEEIEKQYSHKSRHYHSLDHIKFMLLEADKVKDKIEDYDAFIFSIYYHDIIYKASKSDNEHQSALVCEKRLSKTNFPLVEKCMCQIEESKAHLFSDDADTNYFLDIDLGVLGQSWDVYEKYAKNVRKEYKIYPNIVYNKGRKQVLQHFLDLKTIYKTSHYQELFETQARENLKREMVGWFGIIDWW